MSSSGTPNALPDSEPKRADYARDPRHPAVAGRRPRLVRPCRPASVTRRGGGGTRQGWAPFRARPERPGPRVADMPFRRGERLRGEMPLPLRTRASASRELQATGLTCEHSGMPSSPLTELLKLPAGDRAELAMALWESLTDAEREGELELSEADRAELDRRWTEHLANPHSAIPWSEVRSKLIG